MTGNLCTKVPKYSYMDVDVYMAFSADHLQQKMSQVMKTLKYEHTSKENYLVAHIPHFSLFLDELLAGDFFNDLEYFHIHLLPLEEEEFFTFGLFERMQSLNFWLEAAKHKVFLDLLQQDKIQTLFQPILRTADLEPFGYEALSRGMMSDGRLMGAKALFESANTLGLIYCLDQLCRKQAVMSASKRGLTGHLFINFYQTAIIEPEACLRSTLQTIADSDLEAHKFIFEVVDSENTPHYSHLKKILTVFKNNGIKTALDDVGSELSLLEAHRGLNTNFLKVKKELIRHIDQRPENQAYLSRIMELKYKYGIAIIAKGIETESEYLYLKAQGVDFVQGHYFGKPE